MKRGHNIPSQITRQVADEALLRSILASSGVSPGVLGFESVFVYRPLAVNPQPPVYSTWASLYAQWALVPGPKILQVDTSISLAPAVVPAGTYNMDGATITSQNEDTLSFAIGSRITATFLRLLGGVTVSADGNSPVWTPATPFSLLEITESSVLQGTTADFIHLPAAVPLSINLTELSFLGNGVNNVATVDAGGTISVKCYDGSILETNAIAGLGTLALSLSDDGTQNAVQPIAVTNTTLLSSATNLGYTPGVAGNWHPAPTEGAAALDQLAARCGRVIAVVDQTAGATAASGQTVALATTGSFTPNGVTPVRLAGYGGGVVAIGVTSCWLNIETSVNGGVSWTLQKRSQLSGIPDAIGGVTTSPEFMAANIEAYPTLTAVPTLARLSISPTNGGASAFVAGAANEGVFVAQQF